MTVICSDTNATISGIVIPMGTYEWPAVGNLVMVSSGGWSNTVAVGASDTVIIDRTQVVLSSGPEPMLWFCAGLGVILSMGTLLGFARWLQRALGGIGRTEL